VTTISSNEVAATAELEFAMLGSLLDAGELD
jgi:hypothetical protein